MIFLLGALAGLISVSALAAVACSCAGAVGQKEKFENWLRLHFMASMITSLIATIAGGAISVILFNY